MSDFKGAGFVSASRFILALSAPSSSSHSNSRAASMKRSDCGLISFGFLDVATDHISVFFDGENNDQWRQMHGGSGNRISTTHPIRSNNPKCERIPIKSIDHRSNGLVDRFGIAES